MDYAITVLPAYGRDYKSEAELKAAWAEGKDFKESISGSMISRREADRMKLEVWGRYDRQTKKILLRAEG